MLRRTSMLLGMAILLSLLFPLKAMLKGSGVDPLALPLLGLDLAAAGALLAIPPAVALDHFGRFEARLLRWNAWLALLAVFSLVFLALHVHWSLDFLTAYARDAIALPFSHLAVIDAVDLACQVGVLVCVVGALVNLQAITVEVEFPPRRPPRKRRS